MSDPHFRLLERLYTAAPCNAALAPIMRIEHGRATVRFAIQPDMHHAMQGVHGAFYFKALDDAAFFAANSVVTDVFVLTVSFTVQFLRPIAEGEMIAEGVVVKAAKELLFAESVVRDGAGRELGKGT